MKGVSITSKEDLRVPSLTSKERKWIESLQRVLAACPDRLELVTIGDSSLSVIDKDGDSELYDGRAERDGVVLSEIVGGPAVHGVSG